MDDYYSSEDGSGYDSSYDEGSSDYSTSDESGQLRPRVKHKMVRFFDFSAEPGKSYRYRVQLVLEDPNRPANPAADPNKRILERTVVERLAKIEAEDEAYFRKEGKRRRTFYVKTEWSEPSNVVSLSKLSRVVGGSVQAGKRVKIGMAKDAPTVQTSGPAGTLVVVEWDKRRAIEVPAKKETQLGSLLNFTQNADVLHPQSFQILTVENFEFNTEAFVVDMRGGDPLIEDRDKNERTEYPTPGEILVINGDGELVVCNEVDDVEEYRRLLFIEDQPDAATTSSDYSEDSSSEGYEYGSGSEYFD
jgi:hypothetical protein